MTQWKSWPAEIPERPKQTPQPPAQQPDAAASPQLPMSFFQDLTDMPSCERYGFCDHCGRCEH